MAKTIVEEIEYLAGDRIWKTKKRAWKQSHV